MASKSRHSVAILAVAAAVLVLGITATYVILEAKSSQRELEVLGTVSQFQLTERSGLEFGLDEMRGKINVVDFIFTGCQGPCPVMADNMSSLYKAFAGSDKVQFISISVDPTRDRLQVLQEYARKQGVTDNRWVFLRGNINTIQWLSEGVFKLAADDLPALHSTKFILVDDIGQIRGYYSGTDKASVNVLKTHIRELVQENT
jgi:protein SCO1/2